MTNLRAIFENPYRTLGVFANAGMREIASQKNRISAPGSDRNQEIPLDLKGFLPPAERSEEKIREAYSLLTLPSERLKHTQFWFLKMTPNDDTAFQSLFKGDIEEAIRIWENEDSLSSLQNRMICRFLQEDIPAAIEMAEKLYALYGDDYQRLTLPNVHTQMGRSELVHQFIDTLGRDLPLTEIFDDCHEMEWHIYIQDKCSKDILDAIEDELRMAESADADDANVQLRTAGQLVERTKPLFADLQNILPVDDVQYSTIADKAAMAILDCCIRYYNKSTNDTDKRTSDITPMLDFARNLACGETAVSRLDENITIIQENAKNPGEPDFEYSPRNYEEDDKTSVISAIISLIITIFLIVRALANFF